MFFILGSPRSGTTLLSQCLNNHPDIFIPDETDFIIPLSFVFDRISNPDLGKEILFKIITNSNRYKFSIGEYLNQKAIFNIINDCNYHPAVILKALYLELAKISGKKIAGDKSPNDLSFLRILVKVGGIDDPTIKILHIVRDIRDVMVSLNRVKWVENIDLYFPRFWTNSNLYLYSLYKEEQTKYFLIRYEDMVRSSESVFSSICKFLGVDFKDSMLDYRNFNSRYKGMPAHENLYSSISSKKIGIYKKKLSKKMLCFYERQAREGLEEFGYFNKNKGYLEIIKNKICEFYA